MQNDRYEILNYSKFNRRLLNLYWICNGIILVVEIAICIAYFSGISFNRSTEEVLFPVYIYQFIFIPSGLTFLFTLVCEILVWILQKKRAMLQPYVVTFTCVAFCMVLIVVHYSVNVIYITCTMPIIFSLVYNDKCVLLFTFIFSLLIFIGIYGYVSLSESMYLRFDFAEATTSSAILIITYLVCKIILGRFHEIINILVEKEHAEYELEMAKSRAEAKVEARTRFLTNISHDIRTPMNGIIGLAELGLDDGTDVAKQRGYLANIKKSAEGLLGIINDILDFSKIEVGELKLEKTPFYLCDVLSECETIMKPGVEEKGLTFCLHDETGLENALIGDPTKLRTVLLNLLSNAVKFTKKGSVSLAVQCDHISENSDAVTIRFAIKDTGIGMSKEQYARIFEPFRQADDSTTRNYGGTGLGLSIVKNIIEMMGGQIYVESAPDVGSTFWFSIVFRLLQDKNDSLEDAADHIMVAEQPLFDGEALVCEDNEINQQVIVENLEKTGLKVTTAKNGKDGIDALGKGRQNQKTYDIILMDIQMPVMDGLDAAKRMIEMGIKTPIIAMTATIMPEDREKYLCIGMSDCLRKPFKRQELWSCLLKYLKPVEQTPFVVSGYLRDRGAEEKEVIDMGLGIENSAGNDVLYNKILISFLEKQRNTYIYLEKAVAEQDYSFARQIAHKESGFAAIIGAVRLSELLSDLEEVFKIEVPDDPSCMMDAYSKELDNVLEYISDLNLVPEND